MRVKCENCDEEFNGLMGERVRCATCGREQLVRAGTRIEDEGEPGDRFERPHVRALPCQGTRGRERASPKATTRARAITGLVANVIVPGIGTLIFGRRGEGGMQLLLLVLGILTIPWLVGLAVIAGVWIWAVAGGVLELLSRPTASKGASPN